MNFKNQNLKHIKRNHFMKIRANSASDLQEKILDQVIISIEKRLYKNSKKRYVGIYWPLRGEIDLTPLKNIKHLSLALPAVNKKRLITYHAWEEDNLKKDLLGIPAPLDNPALKPSQLKMLLVPAISIDESGFRLGYGGGYYDQLRSNSEWFSITSLVVLPNSCISPTILPRDSWDIPFNAAITENGEESF